MRKTLELEHTKLEIKDMTTTSGRTDVQLSALSIDEMEWTEEMKVLAVDKKNYSVEYLLNLPAGTTPATKHKHICETYSYCLEGSYKNLTTGVEYRRGDFMYQPYNDVHAEEVGPDGTLIYVSLRAINRDGNVFEFYGENDEIVGSMTFDDFVRLLPTE